MNLNEKHTKDIPDEVVEAFVHQHPEGASLEQIAQTVGLTRERVAQIVRKALEKLRRVAVSRGLEVDDIPSRESTWDKMASS